MKGDGKDFFQGCGNISQKIFSRTSSTGSLEEGGDLKAMRANEEISLKQVQIPNSGRLFRKRLSTLAPATLVKKLLRKEQKDKHGNAGLGTLSGVLIPTCENMWGVLIFLRFYYIVGNAGVWQSFIIVFLSFLCAILTTMSLSAIATNGPIEEGGTYYLISRALGPKLGGSVGFMYYLGVSLLAVLEALGAVEMLLFTFPGLKFVSANRVLGAIILCILCFLVYFGISFVSKLSLVFFALVLYTMLSYYLGLFLAPRGEVPENLTGLSWNTFKGNWSPGYEDGVSFSVVLAVFFPCFTGILSGADRAKNLARPEKAIPTGTIGAVVISLLLYLSYMGLWAAVGTRDYLLGRLPDGSARGYRGGHGNLEVVPDIGFPLAILTQLGIIIASMAQAFQCLITSPRLLQAIAGDGIIPVLGRLAKTSENGEPRAALLATTVLCVLAAMIGSLDAVAPLVSICFLTCYSALNFSCVVLSMLKAPSWRPKWKYYHWSFALVGFFLCFAMNFVIKWYWAIAAVVVLILLYIYIDYRQVEVDWGTGLGGLRLKLAVQSILSVGHEARYSVNWRPQLLCLCKPRSARAPDDPDSREFLSFISQLKKGRGLCVMATVLEGKLETIAPQIEAERLELENCMQAAGVTGFARVLVAPSYKEGKTYAIQSSGLGGLEPNTLVLGWPNKWREDDHYHSAEVMLEILTECKAVDKSVLLCMNLDEFPTSGAQQEGCIDVWWIVHDGGLLLILAHLLKRHRVWRKCKLRVYTVAEQFHDPLMVKKNLRKLLEQARIEAEVQVLELDDTGLAPYTFDNTLRLEEAQAYAERLVQYRSSQENQKRMQGPGPSGRVSEQPTITRSKSDRETLENIFKRSDVATTRNGTQNIPRSEPLNESPTSNSLGSVPDKSANDNDNFRSTAANSKRCSNDQLEKSELGKQMSVKPQNTENTVYLMKSKSGRPLENILKKTVPAELSMLDGIHPQPRPTPRERIASLHGLANAHGGTDKHNLEKEDPSTINSRRTKESKLIEGNRPLQNWQEGPHGDATSFRSSSMPRLEAVQSPTLPYTESVALGEYSDKTTALETQMYGRQTLRKGEDSIIPKESLNTEVTWGSTQQKVGKETRWADDYGQELDDADPVEIIVDDSEDANPDGVEEEGGQSLVRSGSAGQLYPGSPIRSEIGRSVAAELSEAVNRTWGTFSQSFSPNKLNELILEQSQSAQLVLLNLPDHYQGMEPGSYMEYCENLTRGLRRVLLVHGTGKELWNSGM